MSCIIKKKSILIIKTALITKIKKLNSKIDCTKMDRTKKSKNFITWIKKRVSWKINILKIIARNEAQYRN